MTEMAGASRYFGGDCVTAFGEWKLVRVLLGMAQADRYRDADLMCVDDSCAGALVVTLRPLLNALVSQTLPPGAANRSCRPPGWRAKSARAGYTAGHGPLGQRMAAPPRVLIWIN